eukprot:jgi/Ulvmu1/6927/UM032_0005.1
MRLLSLSSAWLAMAWTTVLAVVMAYVARRVPEMVMDEIFHVPQTQQYCRGDWKTWDQKITTLPGTYVLGAVYGLFMQTTGLGGCPLLVLRTLNTLLGSAVFVTVVSILHLQWPEARKWDVVAMAVAACMLPTHFFFQFLYYTDVAGVLCVLLSYERSMRRQWVLSAVAAAAAVMCRQTNVVWAAFICGVAVLREAAQATGAAHDVVATVEWLLTEWKRVLKVAAGYAAVAAAFAVFVLANGGIVVGDREAHRPTLHAAQLPYACLFTVAAFLPLCLADSALIGDVRHAALRAAGDLVFYASVAAVAAHHGTVAHPYLLADNRHYTFYIWKNVLGRSAALRVALAPAYAAAAYEVVTRLARSGGPLLAGGYVACAIAALLPAGLVEFRYFTVPALLFVAHVRPPHWWYSVAQGVLFVAVNAATLYMFCDRPFRWPDGSVARFMW